MKISFIDIQNFRKLKLCRIELAEKSTIFVGANNSGKTSAMEALIKFLKKSKRKEISTIDLTISNWRQIEEIGTSWIATYSDDAKPDLSLSAWRKLLPTMDIWLDVEESHIHYVSHILPTLDWDGGLLGVRLIFEPKDIEHLYQSFINAYMAAKNTLAARTTANEASTFTLWPKSLRDFLDKKIQDFFIVNAYILDPSESSSISPQDFAQWMEPLENDPFEGLFKIDIINAQRGFSDSNSGEGISNTERRLSVQLRDYFDKHLNPNDHPEESDLEALEAIETARVIFDQKLKTSFSTAIGELECLNYPGFSDPHILLSSKVSPLDGLNHETAVRFKVVRNNDSVMEDFCLPEKYNGLGYQNLISMIFNLIRFRDEWMRVGKIKKKNGIENKPIEPLHLMLIEEPEAHLHAQVQQVFIKKAYSVLRAHNELGDKKLFNTQMVVSTHSSHIAHETEFTGLRYFARKSLRDASDIPYASVINMTTTFDTNSRSHSERNDKQETAKFASRYLKSTHCDLFFADAAILVEGPAERMLVPHFIRTHFEELDRCYISLLEIGGSHAHRLRPLIEALGIPTLVITDLDSIGAASSERSRPLLGKGLRTGNNTLKTWVPIENMLDDVLSVSCEQKVGKCGMVRVTYPCSVSINNEDSGLKQDVIPYTFEDALVLANIEVFKK